MTKKHRLCTLPRHTARLAAAAGLFVALATPALGQEKAVPVPGSLPKTAQPGSKGPGVRPITPGRPNPNNPAIPNRPGQTGQGGNQPLVNPGGATDADKGAEKHEVPNIDGGDGMIEFSGFSEAVELTTLVEIVAETLKINIYSDPNLSGSIVFNAPVKVKKESLLEMLRGWLELHGYVLTFDRRTEFYAVTAPGKTGVDFLNPLSTHVFVTEGIRPSSLKSMIDGLIDPSSSSVVGGSAAGGAKGRNVAQPVPGGAVDENGQPIQPQPAGGRSSGGGRIVYNDELNIIVVLDTARKIEAVENVINRVIEEYARITVTEIPLTYVSPSVAKQRILEMLGQAQQTTGRQQNRGGVDEYGNPIQQQPQQNAAKSTMDNLAERLTASPNGNSLFFRGKKDEFDNVQALVKLIDVSGRLEPRPYNVGASAKAVADIARQRGMGEVTTIQSADEQRTRMNFGYYDPYQGRQQNQNQQQLSGGPVMVVDEGRGQIIYYATPQLHEEMARLIKEISPEDDAIVMREYRLIYAKSDKVAETILGLINNQTPAGEGNNNSSLLPAGGGRNGFNQPIIVTPPIYGGGNDLSISGKNSFVIADEANNQVIVKAPLKEQDYYRELISRLDLPVPQVYVEAKIVTVTGSDDFKLAFETQLINANGTGGLVNTNFGLSSFGTGTGINGRKTVSTGLKGATAALIKSDQVPVVINALQTVTDSRVVSAPTLLVDANAEESSVESNEEQPTAQTNLSNSNGGNDIVSFGGYEKAGTKLVVKKPQIGPGDAVRMEVEVELSSFTGAASGNLPPPKFTNNIKSQVQVPANMTVVIGGVDVNTKRNTTDKIPLIGDIPLIGALFQSQSKFKSDTTLYVFLTPRVQRDPKYGDLSLMGMPALERAGLDPTVPAFKPVLVDFVEIVEPGHEAAKDAPAKDAPTNPETKPGA